MPPTETNRPVDNWAGGDAYEGYVGRWSRRVASEFLPWLAVPARRRWLDVGCGTGALSQAILRSQAPAHVKGVDRSEDYIRFAREQSNDPLAEFTTGDAQSLPVESGTYDAAVSGLVLNFVPRPELAAAEMVRAVRPRGTVAIYVWDYGGRMQLLRHFWDAAAALDPAVRELDEGPRFPLCQPPALRKLFEDAGLRQIEVRPIEVPTVFRDFDDYWSPFLGGQGPAGGYAMSLSEQARLALASAIRLGLPIETDGSIHLVARAWAARGRV